MALQWMHFESLKTLIISKTIKPVVQVPIHTVKVKVDQRVHNALTIRCAQFASGCRDVSGTAAIFSWCARLELRGWKWWPKVCSWNVSSRGASCAGWGWLGAKPASAQLTCCCRCWPGRHCLQEKFPFSNSLPHIPPQACAPHAHGSVGHNRAEERDWNSHRPETRAAIVMQSPWEFWSHCQVFFHYLLQLRKHDVMCTWNTFSRDLACCPLAAVIKTAITLRRYFRFLFVNLCFVWDRELLKVPYN